MRLRTLVTLLVIFVCLISAFPVLAARTVRDDDTVPIRGNTPPFARPELDVGPLDGDVPFDRMVLVLKRRAGVEEELRQLLEAQQDPASPLYHQWITPEEFGRRFGPADDDIVDVVSWLERSGFRIDEIAGGHGWINFSGRVSDVERVLKTSIRQYRVGDRVLHANATDPEFPRALTDLIAGVASLNNDFPTPMHVAKPIPAPDAGTGPHYLAPSDFATIYNVSPLYSAGFNGSGQTIAVVGRTDINISDVRSFRSAFGLPANDPVFIHNGPAPGNLGGNEEGEGDLDVEWSGAVARNATIDFVISASTQSSDGTTLSSQYIVNHNLAPVITMSFGLCEAYMSSSYLALYADLWTQATAQGITVFVSSGDSGAAGCDLANDSSGTSAAVSGLCSTDFNVCVGGTQFLDTATPGAYWSSSGNALSYIPESAWNESGSAGGSGLLATGGGASIVYSKPWWQSGPGVPNDGARDVPDVSLTSAAHDAYIVYKEGTVWHYYGTSAAAPSMAGIMALIVQKSGGWQGNVNPTLYALAQTQYTNGSPVVFHDVTVGNNTVPGVTGFNCTTGYDRATGVGSVDASALANAWPSGGTGSPSELIVDGGFEQATSGTSAPGWTVLPASGHTIIVTNGSYPHSGTKYALLGGSTTTSTDILKQTVTIPSNATSVTVSFWLNIVTQEIAGDGPFDQLSAALYTTNGLWLANVASFTNENAVASSNTNGVYFKAGPIDVTAFRGQTVQLVFEGDTDSSLSTTFRLDDVSMQVKTGGSDQPPTTSITTPVNGATVGGTVSVNATASDDVAVTSLEIDIDGSPRASNTNSTSLSYSWNTAVESNSQHTIVSKAHDGFGHVTTSSSVVVTVSNCTSYSLTPPSANPNYQSGSVNVTVTGSPAGCIGGWTASGNGSWLTVSPQGGSGSGPVTVAWGQNPSTSARSGNATIGGTTFPVQQGGAPTGVIGFYVITPCRVIDTRYPNGPYGGPALAAATLRNFVAWGQCGIPTSATSLSVNVAVVAPAAVGWLTLYPGPTGNTRPIVSTINFTTGKTIANNAIVGVAGDGSFNVYNGGTAAANFIVDVNGYFK